MSKGEELALLARGFAGPVEDLNEEFFDALAVGSAHEAALAWLDRTFPREAGGGLRKQIETWSAGSVTREQTWNPIFGQLWVGGDPRTQRTSGAAIRLGLRLGYCGVPGEWRLSCDAPTALTWEAWVLPPSNEVRFASEGRVAEIEFDDGDSRGRAEFRLVEGRWTSDWPVRDPEVRLLDNEVVLSLAGAKQDRDLAYLHGDLLPEGDWSAAADRFAAARDVLECFAPEYLRWTDRVTRVVIPLRGDGAEINSGSSRDQPGSSHMSFDGPPEALAEMLVHEGTHQYSYLLSRIGPVDDGSDPTSYYSPIKRRGRPIHYILLAYHAFANVLLFSKRCLDGGFEDRTAHLRRNLADLPPQLDKLEEALTATRALTPLGRALWEPLREALR